MKLQKALKKLYNVVANDEILLRLLHYVPKNSLDNPLDTKKVNINDMSPVEKQKVLALSLLASDKKYDLDLKTKICRLCFYTGTRQPLTFAKYGGVKGDNPYASEQKYNFDIYVHVDIDIQDFRMTAIADRLNELLLLEKITDVGDMVLDFISPIGVTPDGFLGLKVVYKAVSLQESVGR